MNELPGIQTQVSGCTLRHVILLGTRSTELFLLLLLLLILILLLLYYLFIKCPRHTLFAQTPSTHIHQSSKIAFVNSLFCLRWLPLALTAVVLLPILASSLMLLSECFGSGVSSERISEPLPARDGLVGLMAPPSKMDSSVPSASARNTLCRRGRGQQ